MTETADPDYSDPVSRHDAADDYRTEDGNAAAEERSDRGRVQLVGDGCCPEAVRPDTLGETSMSTDNGLFVVRAEIVISTEALLTLLAGLTVPSKTDSLPYFQMSDEIAFLDDSSRHFVAWNNRVAGHSPVIAPHTEIAVAKAAIVDRDFDFIRSEFSGIVFEDFQFSLWFFGGVGSYTHAPGYAEEESRGSANLETRASAANAILLPQRVPSHPCSSNPVLDRVPRLPSVVPQELSPSS